MRIDPLSRGDGMSVKDKFDSLSTYVLERTGLIEKKSLEELAELAAGTEKPEMVVNSDTDSHNRSGTDTPAGKVVTDSEGNRVWEWIADTIDGTSRLLRRLNSDDLKLEDTQVAHGSASGSKDGADKNNPYNADGIVKPQRRG